jgi:hypothetical protein
MNVFGSQRTQAFPGAKTILAQLRLEPAVRDAENGDDPSAQQSRGIQRQGEFTGGQERIRGLFRGKQADAAGDQAAVHFQCQPFELQVIALPGHAVQEDIGQIGRQTHQVQISEQNRQQNGGGGGQPQHPRRRMPKSDQQEGAEAPPFGMAFRPHGHDVGFHVSPFTSGKAGRV